MQDCYNNFMMSNERPLKKPQAWKITSIVLGFLTLLTSLVCAVGLWAASGIDGPTKAVALFLTLPLIFLVMIMVITDTVVAIAYLAHKTPRGVKLVFPLTVALIGGCILTLFTLWLAL
jgi:uncharacterized Tic20 family protein